MMKHIALSLILSGFFALQVSAQSLLKNDEIPDDLMITLHRTGRFEDYVITIQANGDWSFKGYAGLPVQRPLASILSLGGKTDKKIDETNKKIDDTKAKLTKETLKSLISEFEKIQFFKFGKDFPPEDEEIRTTLSDQSTETISIRINGQTKEISNYLGDSGNRTATLRDLAERIRAVKIWNLENGEIPADLSITYRTDFGEGNLSDTIIDSDGRVSAKFYSNFPSNSAAQSLLITKNPKLKERISKKQLERLISEFERIGFSAFAGRDLDKRDGCTNESLSTHSRTNLIFVQINNRNIYASIGESCNPKPGTDAAKFAYLMLKIEEILKDVKVTKINPK
jgi:hypothetical protein